MFAGWLNVLQQNETQVKLKLVARGKCLCVAVAD